MVQLSITEARRRLSDLVRQAAAGETIVITRRGRAVAKLIGAVQPPAVMTPDEAITRLLEFRRTHSLGGLRIRDLIDEGRKY